MPDTGTTRGMRSDQDLWIARMLVDHAGRTIRGADKIKWNEKKWMRWAWRNGAMKIVVGENGRNPEKNLSRPRLVHHETHMEWPRGKLGAPVVGGERETKCLRQRQRVRILTWATVFPIGEVVPVEILVMLVLHTYVLYVLFDDRVCLRTMRLQWWK